MIIADFFLSLPLLPRLHLTSTGYILETSRCPFHPSELIPALQTSEEVTRRSRAFAEACGKQVTTSADTPGFLANRILMPYINEAIICLETGVGNKEDLDTTAKLGFGHPMGEWRKLQW